MISTTGRKRSEHYVNNKDFLIALIEYRAAVKKAALKENPEITDEELRKWKSPNKPPVPRYVGECFLKIANHLSYQTKLCELHVQGGHDL